MQPSDTLFVGRSELAGLMRSTDWTQTAVGAPDHWPQSVRAIVRLMQRNALRLQKLVNALLDFSRFEAGRIEASFEPVEIGR